MIYSQENTNCGDSAAQSPSTSTAGRGSVPAGPQLALECGSGRSSSLLHTPRQGDPGSLPQRRSPLALFIVRRAFPAAPPPPSGPPRRPGSGCPCLCPCQRGSGGPRSPFPGPPDFLRSGAGGAALPARGPLTPSTAVKPCGKEAPVPTRRQPEAPPRS